MEYSKKAMHLLVQGPDVSCIPFLNSGGGTVVTSSDFGPFKPTGPGPVELCRRSGFKKVTLRGDTDFSQTKHLDRWDEQEVQVSSYSECPR